MFTRKGTRNGELSSEIKACFRWLPRNCYQSNAALYGL